MTDKIAATEQLIIEQLLAKPNVPETFPPKARLSRILPLTALLS
ncbi:hypothetical protein DOFOFD_10855 [Acetobacteraceae bacterium EV16P]|uniref:Uncharacterized protein n=1 Tax=Sorlinia euscelidii TaxID=3081148 RepID=A0ABU7U6J2_9PROT